MIHLVYKTTQASAVTVAGFVLCVRLPVAPGLPPQWYGWLLRVPSLYQGQPGPVKRSLPPSVRGPTYQRCGSFPWLPLRPRRPLAVSLPPESFTTSRRSNSIQAPRNRWQRTPDTFFAALRSVCGGSLKNAGRREVLHFWTVNKVLGSLIGKHTAVQISGDPWNDRGVFLGNWTG